MDNRQETHHRQSNRLPHYDYSQTGAYFVTIVTCNHVCSFGEVRDGAVWLNALGRIADRMWREIPEHFPHVTADDDVIMPNHVHGVIVFQERDVNSLRDVGAAYMPPLRNVSLGVIVATFKAAVTREIHTIQKYTHLQIWHPNDYEHVIRDKRDYEKIVDYIEGNPLNWAMDSEYRK